MKATGIVRKVDDLGRIVLPIELRRTLSIDIKDPLEIYVDGEYIILKQIVNDDGNVSRLVKFDRGVRTDKSGSAGQ